MIDDLFISYSSLIPQKYSKDEDYTDPLRYIDLDLYSPESDSSFPQNDILDTAQKPQGENYNQIQLQPQNNGIETEQRNDSPQLKGSKSFEQAFEQALKINPEIVKYKNFLVKTAKRESGFNSYIQNTSGAPYYGYFQMGKNEIALTTRMTVEDFRNNPVAQILGACKLYEMNLKTIKKLGVYDIGRRKGYSDDALVAGAWMGGPGGVKKYLLGLGDPSDSHWYKNGGGSSVGKIMNNWKKEDK